MRRRDFIKCAGSVVAWPLPLVARAQQAALPLIGFVNSAPRQTYQPQLAALFSKGLGEAGYFVGGNVAIEYRWAEGQHDRLPSLAADLVKRQVGSACGKGCNPNQCGDNAEAAAVAPRTASHGEGHCAPRQPDRSGHGLVSIAALDGVILPLEGDALLVEGDQAAVGDGNAVGATRQIGQHRFGSAERALCVDDPLGFAQRHQKGREGLRIGEMGVAEEAQAAGCSVETV